MSTSRREFLVAACSAGATAAIAGTLVACGCGGDAGLLSGIGVLPNRFVYCLSLRGRRGSNAAKRNAAYKRFATVAAAEAGRAHPGDNARVVSVPISEAQWQAWFGNGAQVIDLRNAP